MTLAPSSHSARPRTVALAAAAAITKSTAKSTAKITAIDAIGGPAGGSGVPPPGVVAPVLGGSVSNSPNHPAGIGQPGLVVPQRASSATSPGVLANPGLVGTAISPPGKVDLV